MSRGKDWGSKRSPLANRKQMAYQGILLLKAEKQNASNRQINRATINHSQSITVIYSLSFQKEASHGSWMPFSFSASVHQPCEILQPFKAPLSWAGWLWVALGSAPSPTTSHQSSSTALHLCHPHSTGTAPAFLGVQRTRLKMPALPAAFWPAHKKKSRYHPPLRAKTDCKLPWKHGDMLIAFPFLKKSDFWVGVRRKQAGVREGRACGSWSPGRSVNSHVQMLKHSHNAETWKETGKLN